MLGIKFKTLGL